MCDLCSNIPTEEEYNDQDWWDMTNSIIYEKDTNTYYFFSAVDDWYYNHIVIRDMKYCPCCGRRLDDDTNR